MFIFKSRKYEVSEELTFQEEGKKLDDKLAVTEGMTIVCLLPYMLSTLTHWLSLSQVLFFLGSKRKMEKKWREDGLNTRREEKCDPLDHMYRIPIVDRLSGWPCMAWNCQVSLDYSRRERRGNHAEQWLVRVRECAGPCVCKPCRVGRGIACEACTCQIAFPQAFLVRLAREVSSFPIFVIFFVFIFNSKF